ncbi:MAG: HAMP domain-containing protein [Alphaproteobacteria bacterium]|nr:HAMP domain-containing protein [Alphaproteobacteria bacterium]
MNIQGRNYSGLKYISLNQLNIRNRLLLGFGAICLILTVAVGITIFRLDNIDGRINSINRLRVPTSSASSDIVAKIYTSVAALRGYMLTGQQKFKIQRTRAWVDMDELKEKLDALSVHWSNPRDIKNWAAFKAILGKFRAAQITVENIAGSPEQYPATEILNDKAMPHEQSMIREITRLIDLEGQMPTTIKRKKLLGVMADVHGTFGLGLANIRAFLLTGKKKFEDKFNILWAENQRRFKDMQKMSGLFGPKQAIAFAIFSKQRAQFSPLPAKMFAIRSSDKWNMANYLLTRDVTPRAGKLLDILVGANGREGMAAGQHKALEKDVAYSLSRSDNLMLLLWILLAAGLVLSVGIALLAARSITRPVDAMTGAMTKLAGGDTSVEVPGLDRADEIGVMAVAVESFKQNALERIRLEQETREA